MVAWLLPRGTAMLARSWGMGIVILSVRPPVCPSHACFYCVHFMTYYHFVFICDDTKEHTAEILTPHKRVFWYQKRLVSDVLFHLKFALKVTNPLWKASTSTNIWDRWQRLRRPRMQRRLHNLPLKISFNNRQIQQSLSHVYFTRDFKTTGIAYLALDRSAERLYDVEIGIPTRPSQGLTYVRGILVFVTEGWHFDVKKLPGRIASFRWGFGGILGCMTPAVVNEDTTSATTLTDRH